MNQKGTHWVGPTQSRCLRILRDRGSFGRADLRIYVTTRHTVHWNEPSRLQGKFSYVFLLNVLMLLYWPAGTLPTPHALSPGTPICFWWQAHCHWQSPLGHSQPHCVPCQSRCSQGLHIVDRRVEWGGKFQYGRLAFQKNGSSHTIYWGVKWGGDFQDGRLAFDWARISGKQFRP